MKFETFLLRGLFIACFAVCALIVGAMLNTTPSSTAQAVHDGVASVLLAAPTSCSMHPDGVICPRLG